MQSPREFYTQQKETFTNTLHSTKKRLYTLSSIRLLVFIAMITGIYFSIGITYLPVVIGVLGFSLFLFLVSKYTDIKYKKEKLEALIEINQKELEAINGDYTFFDAGEAFSDADHAFCNDIDLFGKGSFFQAINRTVTDAGRKTLAQRLKANDITSIEQKQEGIKELQSMPEWQQDFRATASLVKTETDAETIIHWLKNYRSFTPKYAKLLVIGFSMISVLIISLAILGVLRENMIWVLLALGFGILSPYSKRIINLSQNTSKIQDIFQQYYKLLMQIEATDFSSDVLKEKHETIHSEAKKASQIVRAFSKALDALDQQNNIFFMIPANGFFLWSLWQAQRIEKWIASHKDQVENWFDVISFFDAEISLANFAFNHPHYIYPEINEDGNQTKVTSLGHPLVNEEKLVRNDFNVDKGQFFVITGANMAGKSTFLRTVSLHHVMANTGLPVCAASSTYMPIKLISSMRTSDSLSDDESYFFSELKRLKHIIDHIEGDTYFIVLDEILKGTNSKDKAEGSKKFLEKLTNSKSTGIIATHDLSLCKVAEEYAMVKNYYFDAYIENDELSFDYKFKEGICQNMNASFLLQKMGIV
ncbi:DNA mismatch repair protein MutS [Flavobacteriaceae bacterium R38]|nr:DNA mismatch repair protein MutS [Flavobacteriaceae bacterium R38]